MAQDSEKNIDAGKDAEKDEEKKPNYYGFFSNYGQSLIFILCIILVGTIGLYTTKVAMSGILPTKLNENDKMYTNISSNTYHKFVPINSNAPSINGKSTVQEAEFSPEQFASSFNHGMLCELNKHSNKSNFGLYLSSVINYIATMNNFATNSAYGWLGETVPESAITILYPLLLSFIIPLTYIFNFGISLFAHIKYLPQYFRKKMSGGAWEPEQDISYFNIKNIFLFGFLWWWVSLISVFLSTPCMSIYSIISPLFATYTKYKEKGETQNLASFLKDALYYKKNLILILSMISLAKNTSTYLGNEFLIGVAISVLVGIFGLGILKNPAQTISQSVPPSEVNNTMLPGTQYKICTP